MFLVVIRMDGWISSTVCAHNHINTQVSSTMIVPRMVVCQLCQEQSAVVYILLLSTSHPTQNSPPDQSKHTFVRSHIIITVKLLLCLHLNLIISHCFAFLGCCAVFIRFYSASRRIRKQTHFVLITLSHTPPPPLTSNYSLEIKASFLESQIESQIIPLSSQRVNQCLTGTHYLQSSLEEAVTRNGLFAQPRETIIVRPLCLLVIST